MEREIALNAETINSFCLANLVEVSAFRMLSACFALVMMTFICCENVGFGSRVIPRIFECFVVHSVCLFNLLYSTGSGVKSVGVEVIKTIKRPTCYDKTLNNTSFDNRET